eukprot:PhM_4_TR2315/c0_g1_i1/m.45945
MYTRMGSLGGPWDAQLMECFDDIGLCCLAMVCPSCLLAHERAVLNYKNCSPADALIMSVCLPCSVNTIRNDIKAKYGIYDEPVWDCLAATCCIPCGVTQHHRQMTLHGDTPGGPCMA